MNHSKKLVLAGLAYALGSLLVGCSGSDEGSSAPLPIEQFPQQFSSALCEAIGPCCMDAALPYVAATCKRSATEEFTARVTYADSPKIKYDAAAAGECLSQYKEALANCQLPSAFSASACGRIFVGTLATGAACNYQRNECATGHCERAVNSAGAEVSICVAETGQPSTDTIPEGGDCGTFIPCAAGLYCPFETGVCTKRAPIGGACMDYEGCQKGAYCAGPVGVCTAQSDSGPCTAGTPLSACSANTYCSALDSFSVEGECLKKKPDGYACRQSEECLKGVCNGMCGPAAAATTTSCSGSFEFPGYSGGISGL